MKRFKKFILILLFFSIIVSGVIVTKSTVEAFEEENSNTETQNSVETKEASQSAQIKMEYVYDETTNQVIAYMISDIELQDTKPTWSLSEDKKTYTKTFSENMNYSTPAQDIYGNIISVEINITEVRKMEINTKYEYNSENNTVLVTMTSNVNLKNTKPTWNFGEDQKTYTKIYNVNEAYSTKVESVSGEIVNVELNINQIDLKGPEIVVDYKYNRDNTITIYLESNEKLGDTKPTWKLSEDKMVYEKTYSTQSENYPTQVQDIYGNITNVQIVLEKKNEEFNFEDLNVNVGYIYTVYDEVIVQIMSNKDLKDTKPTWDFFADNKTYVKIYNADEEYYTAIETLDGERYDIKIAVDFYTQITMEKGTYGMSGAKIRGVNGGIDLEYYRYGNGENVLFATFAVHGFEDSWDRDGGILLETADNFYNRLVSDQDKDIAKNWTIYIFREVNPDGRRLGSSNMGPGRTTLYSKVDKGIDINRSWQTGSDYKIYTDSRNYNGTAGFQAYEAEYLRNFLLSHKSQNGKTILVDLHGWEDQLIGDPEICDYYKTQYPSCRTTAYGKYGTQYLITWARQNLGAKVALVELPLASSWQQAYDMKLIDKYINATLEMLRNEK